MSFIRNLLRVFGGRRYLTAKALLWLLPIWAISGAYGQAWSGIITPPRAVDWSGVGAGTIPVRATICSTLSAGASAASINSAISACPAGEVVFLNAGTYNLSAGILIEKSVSLRGAGADQTLLKFTGTTSCNGFTAAICLWNGDGNFSGGPSNTANWTAGYSAGTTSITLSAHTNLKVGGLLQLDQFNDTYQFSAASCVSQVVTATIGANTFSMSNGLPIITVQGASPSGYNSPTTGGSYPITAITGTTVSYNLGHTCPGTYVSGGTATLDDGALTISNDGTFSSFHAQGNNPGRPANSCGPGGFQCRSSTQTVTVTGCGTTVAGAACTSNTVTISPGIYDPHIRTDRSPGAWWSTALPLSGAGVEALSIDGSGISTTNNVTLLETTGSWVKGIRSLFAAQTHVLLIQDARNTVRDSYLTGNQGHGGTSSQSYCTDTYTAATDNLIENNIFVNCAISMQNEGGMGQVYGYGFCEDNDNASNSPPGDFPLNDGSWHAPGTMFNLMEGNMCNSFKAEDFHGNGWAPTLFRNRLRGVEPGHTTQTWAISIQTGARSANLIGNVLGTTGYHIHYTWQIGTDSGTDAPNCSQSIYSLGFSGLCTSRIQTGNCDTNTCEIDDFRANLPNAANPGTTFLFGNWDVVNGGSPRFVSAEIPSTLPIYANSIPATHTLPTSFYGADTTHTSFWQTPWGTPPFPPIGPDVSGGPSSVWGADGGFAYWNPAALAFQNVGLDPAYITTSTVTAGSCTSSKATITIGSAAANVSQGDVVLVSGSSPSNYNCSDRTQCQVISQTSTTVTYPVASCGGAYVSGGSAVTNFTLLFNAANSYSAVSGAATPTFSPTAGAYSSTQSVTPSTTSGSVICYNFTGSPATNGTTGCTTGTLYTTPISVSVSETLFAVAGGTGLSDSSVGSAAYVLQGSAPTFNPIAGPYVGTQTLSLSQAQSLSMCYTTNGTTPASTAGSCSTGTLYTGPILVSVSETVKAIGFQNGWTDSSVGSASYTITQPTSGATANYGAILTGGAVLK